MSLFLLCTYIIIVELSTSEQYIYCKSFKAYNFPVFLLLFCIFINIYANNNNICLIRNNDS